MAGSFGGTVKLTGETEYKKALKEISSNLKVLSSEMKVVTSQYDSNDKSVESLSAKNKALTQQYEAQKSKVDLLKKALEQAKVETGENSNTTKKWQIELNNAQAKLNDTERQIKNNSAELNKHEQATKNSANSINEFAENTEKAGQSTLKFGDIIKANVISEGIITGIKAVANGMKELASGLVSITKDAVNNYAEYEQLVGGVDTLFGESSAKVQNYANNAYKTAGLSANDYMETVTSFSASLIQSLGGDTEKATEYANTAITDMSDNANKMGTDMANLQNAYNGFAKGNYTMLDNLKLGYGGTKEEMERLLADAEKISGVKYDISSYADVTQAIHIMQESMGIAGTTSKEASSTIQGSISAMSSTWQNLLTGLANGNADIDGLITNLVDSVITAGRNILPAIATITIGLGDTIAKIIDSFMAYLPQFLDMGIEILNNLITGILNNLPAITTAVLDILSMLTGTLLDNLPMIIESGLTLIITLAQGITQSLPELIPTVVECLLTIVNTLLDNIDELIECGIQLLVALTDGLMNALPELVSRLPEIIIKVTLKLIELAPQLLSASLQIIKSLAEGLIKYIPEIISRMPQIIKSMINALKNGLNEFKDIGMNLLKGVWQGMSNTLDWLKDKIRGLVGNVTDFIKKMFGIHSPSTVMEEEVGTNLALGVGVGFSNTMKDVSKEMANAIPREYDTTVSLNGSLVNATSRNNNMFDMFIEALKGVKVEIDDREMGRFVTKTVNRVVYS